MLEITTRNSAGLVVTGTFPPMLGACLWFSMWALGGFHKHDRGDGMSKPYSFLHPKELHGTPSLPICLVVSHFKAGSWWLFH